MLVFLAPNGEQAVASVVATVHIRKATVQAPTPRVVTAAGATTPQIGEEAVTARRATVGAAREQDVEATSGGGFTGAIGGVGGGSWSR